MLGFIRQGRRELTDMGKSIYLVYPYFISNEVKDTELVIYSISNSGGNVSFKFQLDIVDAERLRFRSNWRLFWKMQTLTTI